MLSQLSIIRQDKTSSQRPPPNGPLHVVCSIMKNAMASAAEAEMGALFVIVQVAIILRTTLEELRYVQPPTPIKIDNFTASGIANKSIQQRRSRSMDMRFYWVRDRVQQGQFIIYWGPGKDNRGDLYTKHHPTKHCRLHRRVASQGISPDVLQGCANLGINLGTRSQYVTTRSGNQNTGLTMGSGTQDLGLTLSSSIGNYLTKYRRVYPTNM